jgi:metal-dependent amidase/aminoacylase/carboxypeptidase family protein
MLTLHAAEHPAGDLGAIVDRYRPDLRTFENAYRSLHQLPDLPSQEESTSSSIAEYLAQLRFEEVPENIGGHGVVGIVRNGPGKTVLIRAELDALPVQERTRLPYASKEWMEDSWGVERPVMHACAHDMHMTCVLAASSLLLAAK